MRISRVTTVTLRACDGVQKMTHMSRDNCRMMSLSAVPELYERPRVFQNRRLLSRTSTVRAVTRFTTFSILLSRARVPYSRAGGRRLEC